VVQTKNYQDYDATSRGDYIDADGKMHKAGITPSYSEKDKKYMEIMTVVVTAAVVAAMISDADGSSGHTVSSSPTGYTGSFVCRDPAGFEVPSGYGGYCRWE
jgi:hypothetical protein